MATITKPPILDETGQDIALKINALTAQITALYQLLADLGLATLAPISQDDYGHLSPTEQLAGCFDIYDAVEPNIDDNRVAHDNTTVNAVLNTLTSKITGTTDFEVGVYPLTYNNTSINLTGFKIYINPNRYCIIGMVLSGSNYGNNTFAYSSWDGNVYKLNN